MDEVFDSEVSAKWEWEGRNQGPRCHLDENENNCWKDIAKKKKPQVTGVATHDGWLRRYSTAPCTLPPARRSASMFRSNS